MSDTVESTPAYDAELKNAFFLPVDDEYVLIGEIYNDSRKRFADGTDVRTSYIKEHASPDLFRTCNTTYKVEFYSKVNWTEESQRKFMARFGYAHG